VVTNPSSACEMTDIVSGGALNSTHSPISVLTELNPIQPDFGDVTNDVITTPAEQAVHGKETRLELTTHM